MCARIGSNILVGPVQKILMDVISVAGSSLVDPIALSLSEVVGCLKFMAKVAEKAKQIVIEKKVAFILLNQYQFTDPVILKVILNQPMRQSPKSSFVYRSVPVEDIRPYTGRAENKNDDTLLQAKNQMRVGLIVCLAPAISI